MCLIIQYIDDSEKTDAALSDKYNVTASKCWLKKASLAWSKGEKNRSLPAPAKAH